MELSKHHINVGDSVQWYTAPETLVIFVNTQGVLCLSPGNEPLREYDYGDGGFETGY